MTKYDKDGKPVPVTNCTTVTNSKIERTRHGVVRTEVTSKIEQKRGSK